MKTRGAVIEDLIMKMRIMSNPDKDYAYQRIGSIGIVHICISENEEDDQVSKWDGIIKCPYNDCRTFQI